MSTEVTGEGVLEFIEQSGQKVKADLLELLRERLPKLPRYDIIYQGFQETFGKAFPEEFAHMERASGLKIDVNLYDYTRPRRIVVLNYEGIFEIPLAKEDGNSSLKPNYDNMREVDPADYIAFAQKAIDEIDRWTDIAMRSSLVASDNRVQQLA